MQLVTRGREVVGVNGEAREAVACNASRYCLAAQLLQACSSLLGCLGAIEQKMVLSSRYLVSSNLSAHKFIVVILAKIELLHQCILSLES